MSDKPQIHATALETKCLEQFRRRYIENEKIPPGIAAVVGTGTDKSVSRNLSHKIETGGLLTIPEVEETARDGVNEAWRRGVTLTEEEIADGIRKVRGQAVDKAVRLARLHAEQLAPKIQPTHVQRKWTLDISGYPMSLVGTLDVQEGRASIRDTKTSGKTPPPDCAERSLQLKTYATAIKVIDGQMPERVILDFLIDTSKPNTKLFEHEPNDDDMRIVLARLEVLIKCVEAGLFPPVEPTHWICAPRWCGFAPTCRYFLKHPIQFAL